MNLIIESYNNKYFIESNTDTHLWITYIVVGCYAILLPLWILLVIRNSYTRNVLTSGWVPVLSALFISG